MFMSIEDLIQQKTSEAAELHGADLSAEELEKLAQIVWDLLKEEIIEENARMGKLI